MKPRKLGGEQDKHAERQDSIIQQQGCPWGTRNLPHGDQGFSSGTTSLIPLSAGSWQSWGHRLLSCISLKGYFTSWGMAAWD